MFSFSKNKENEEIIHPRDVTESGFEKTLMYLFVYIRLNKDIFKCRIRVGAFVIKKTLTCAYLPYPKKACNSFLDTL